MTDMRDIHGSQVSRLSEVPDDLEIGVGATVWSFSVIEKGVRIGNGVVVGAHCFIGAGTVVGDWSRIQDGAFIPRNTIIEDHVFVGPHVVMTDDKHPMVGNAQYKAQPPRIRSYASIGAGAVILPGVIIGIGCMIGAGAVVTRDVGASELVVGMPARPKGFNGASLADKA